MARVGTEPVKIDSPSVSGTGVSREARSVSMAFTA
jgi:hypothetical protein